MKTKDERVIVTHKIFASAHEDKIWRAVRKETGRNLYHVPLRDWTQKEFESLRRIQESLSGR